MSKYQPKHRAPTTPVVKPAVGTVAATALAATGVVVATDTADAHKGHGLTTQRKVHLAVQHVVAQKGDPYVYGAAGPDSFDCSGLIYYAFGKVGVSLPRTSYDQAANVRRIQKHQAERGDFVFWYNQDGEVFHTAMVAGWRNGNIRVLEAASSGTRIGNHALWSAPHFFGSLRHKGYKARNPHIFG